jgi:hypothetical protein
MANADAGAGGDGEVTRWQTLTVVLVPVLKTPVAVLLLWCAGDHAGF